MSVYRTFMVGSQIVQIAQQMQGNRQLKALHQHQLSQAEAQARLAWVREQLFNVRQNFENAAHLLDQRPAEAAFICESNFLFLDREGISTHSFPDLSEKEYFHQLWQFGESVRTQANSCLSEEIHQQVMRAAISRAVLPELRALAAWTEVAELLPGGYLGRRYVDWQKPSYRVSAVILSVAFFPLAIFPLFLWLTTPYRRVLPRVRQLAQSVGGWVTDHVGQKDAAQIAAQHRAKLEGWGLTLPAGSQALNDAVASAEQMVASYDKPQIQMA